MTQGEYDLIRGDSLSRSHNFTHSLTNSLTNSLTFYEIYLSSSHRITQEAFSHQATTKTYDKQIRDMLIIAEQSK